MNELREQTEIELGKALDRLSKNDDFKILESEILRQIEAATATVMNVIREPQDIMLLIGEQRGQKKILDWIKDEMEAGALALAKKEKLEEAAIPMDPQAGPGPRG